VNLASHLPLVLGSLIRRSDVVRVRRNSFNFNRPECATLLKYTLRLTAVDNFVARTTVSMAEGKAKRFFISKSPEPGAGYTQPPME
jgi:hypothetical protein